MPTPVFALEVSDNYQWKVQCMKVISFALYFIKLRLSVLLGIHKTVNPTGLKWRWNNWNYNYKSRRRHR